MAAALIAVIFALLLDHLLPALVSVRQFGWFSAWLRHVLEPTSPSASGARLLFAMTAPVVITFLLQILLAGTVFGLPAFLFAVAMVFYCWGPRDLDMDVDAVLNAPGQESKQAATERLLPPGTPATLNGPALVDAVFRGAMARWFGVLLWFLLLGPAGALLYRLAHLVGSGELDVPVSPAQAETARRLMTALDWPVAQLMVLGLALVGSFDPVIRAWREWHAARGRYFVLDTGFLTAAGQATVDSELVEDQRVDPTSPEPPPALLELRDAMSLAWRLLLLWLAVVALFVLAGFVG